MTAFRTVLFAAALLSIWIPAGALAQGAPSVAELRAQLEAARRDRPAAVPAGSLLSIQYLIDTAERIDGGRFAAQSESWRRRAARYLARVRDGVDPYPHEKGKITNRAYPSQVIPTPQGYGIYIPPGYDPSRPWPLYVALHGGSSNGNLFLGVVLGNNMPWLQYDQHLWDDYTPRWSPDFIVVAPDGYGQVMWRWMGELDVLSVIEDVQRHYNVDADRVVLGGLSNGGVGAYAIGTRHAWRFSAVQAMAGAPSWVQYAGGRPLPEEIPLLHRVSGLHLAENIFNTDFRYYHGRQDGGPMRPAFVDQFTERVREIGLEPKVTWWADKGHDILYIAHRHGRIYDQLAPIRRDRKPREVRVVTGDYRANRQHWVTVTRIARYPELARVRAVVEGDTITVETSNVSAFALDVRDVPFGEGRRARVVVDGAEAYAGERAPLGHRIHFAKTNDGWRTGYPDEPQGALVKRPGLAGPLTDAYYGRSVHVYGTRDPEHTDALRRAAGRGARGWPMWLWSFQQPVVADTEVTDEMMRASHLVLYGTAGDNAVLERIRDRLPIRIEEDAVVAGDRRFAGNDVGTRFIHPNPLAPDRYVIVQGGVTTAAVEAGHNLPDFVPDYVVYNRETTRTRPRLLIGPSRPLAIGFFDARWRVSSSARGDGAGDEDAGVSPPDASLLPIPPAPPAPPRPRRFLAPDTDPAGRVARELARRVARFVNFRAQIPGATWLVDRRAVWQIRAERDCMAALAEAGVPARLQPPLPTPVPTPVEITGAVGGVWFRETHEDRPLVLSCEMASRLPEIARIVSRHGVRGVDVMSSYRDNPLPSFHTMGLALDIARFWNGRGWLSVEHHFAATPDAETCAGPPPSEARARALRAIACELARSRRFSSVLTPNYNEGHRDHFHLDARPDDPRIFLR